MRRAVATILGLALLMAACAAPAPVTPPPTPLVWPAEPDAPRVRFVQTFSRAEDLGIRKGLLQRVGELLFGSEDLHLIRPMAVISTGSLIYVADPGARGVHRFDRAEGRHQLLRAEGGQPLPSPVGIAQGADGMVYVTDSALRKVFTLAPGAEFAVERRLRAELRQPTGVAFDPASGRLFVTDTAAHCVQVFERDGTLALTIGRRGSADGEFNYPTMLWRDASGRLYVADALNFRVQVFDPQGRFLSKFGRHGDGSGDMARHKGVATDSHGHVYVIDSLLHAVQIFDASGRLLLAIGGQGRDRGEFWLPAGVYIDGDDTIYVADAYNQRVQVLRYVGRTP
ncbi:MAG: SMP-30/gluconolactonase/LRE family protein [Aquincola sp.]|nr:SMP-30/gluconolactonase/LRE family protein [Aquincola sp.]MDH4288519.1 SMP-30/gluconolactonase/LRE family protein [Aquincola sp.]MDH5331473.1 SMP-30/gluconolactonase/LRE family protein [Aquincola sp.]